MDGSMGSMILTVARDSARALRRILQLSPMCAVVREMRRRGITLKECDALECFAFTGAMHTRDYAGKVRSLEDAPEAFSRCGSTDYGYV
jgi:hypothetical protein